MLEPGLVHVHSLDVDPRDGALYAATHSGLFRVDGKNSVQRVGELWHDLMGFTVAGPGDLIASGHPDMRDPVLNDPETKPLLGLVTSDDGVNWEPSSLFGEADFHALEAAHGTVYGWDSTSGSFMASEDRETWERRSQLPLLAFAVSPDDADLILGATQEGMVRSVDGGRTWQPSAGPSLVAVDWEDDAVLGAAADGTIQASKDAGQSWQVRGSVEGQPEALHVEGSTVYAAVAEVGLLQSNDGGATWSALVESGAGPGGEH